MIWTSELLNSDQELSVALRWSCLPGKFIRCWVYGEVEKQVWDNSYQEIQTRRPFQNSVLAEQYLQWNQRNQRNQRNQWNQRNPRNPRTRETNVTKEINKCRGQRKGKILATLFPVKGLLPNFFWQNYFPLRGGLVGGRNQRNQKPLRPFSFVT